MSRQLPRVACLIATLLFSAHAAAPEAAASGGPGGYHFDLYRSGVFVRQYRWTWCVGASSQMMINIVLGTSDARVSSQRTLVQYAMNHDRIRWSNTGGSDATGFAAALNNFGGGGTYHVVTSTNFRQAVRRAAKSMRLTGKPVGLLVMGGRHAWVMSGFDATRDPKGTHSWEVTAVYVLGPLYPREQKGYYDLPPDSRISFKDFRTPFRVFDDRDSPQFVNHWVTVNP
jgi:hypothetical protein